MKKLKREDVKFYKFYNKDNSIWAIVADDSEIGAAVCFCEDFKISESDFRKNYKTEKAYPNVRIKNDFFQKPVSLDTISKIVKFFPRVVYDISDVLDPVPY
jgi:hypothetical protein